MCTFAYASLHRNEIYVYEFPGHCKFLYSVTTRDNPRGLCEISPLKAAFNEDGNGGSYRPEVMIFPGFKSGSLQIVDLSTTEKAVSQSPVTINAHKSDLYCIAINQNVREQKPSRKKENLLLTQLNHVHSK